MQEVDSLYDGMDADNRGQYRKLFAERYLEVLLYLRDLIKRRVKIPEDDEIDELAEMYIAGILSEPNDITHYSYDAEVYRKRDRAKEAVNAVNGRVMKQIEMDKAVRMWSRMTAWYADIASDSANVKAMEDAGVKRVQWHTQEDGRVCADCRKRDGKIYPIDKIPVKPHPSCRCYLTPYIN